MNTKVLKSIFSIFFASLFSLSSCSKEEYVTNDNTKHCISSSYNLYSFENEYYPFVLDVSEYPFQYAIHSEDIGDFLTEVLYSFMYNTHDSLLIMAMYDSLSLCYYGVVDECFILEQYQTNPLLSDDENIVFGTWVRVDSNYSHNYNEIQTWAHAQMENGRTVVMKYDRRTREFIAISYVWEE